MACAAGIWAAPIVVASDSYHEGSSNTYRLRVNNGQNASMQQYLGLNPDEVQRLAFSYVIPDGMVVSSALVDMNWIFDPTVLTRHFAGYQNIADLALTAAHMASYTISIGSYSISGIGGGSFNLLDDATVVAALSASNTDRTITVGWKDTITYGRTGSGSGGFPGTNPYRQFDWGVGTGVTGTAQLTLDLVPSDPSAATPEPGGLVLLGGGLLVVSLARRKRGLKALSGSK